MSALIRTPNGPASRTRRIGAATAGLLILATLPLLATPAAASLPPGPILALVGSWTEPMDALWAAGYQDCYATGGAGSCFVPVSPADFATADFSGRKLIYVGTDPDFGGPVEAALNARAADIQAFLAAGGALIAYSVPTGGNHAYLPDGSSFVPVQLIGDDVQVTVAGQAHPSLNGASSADLSNWDASYHNYYDAYPAWLTPLAENTAGQALTLAGTFGAGCAFVTGQAPDFWTFWGKTTTIQQAASDLVRSTVLWGLNCGGGNYAVLLNTVPHGGYVDIVFSGGAPSLVHDPSITCDPLSWNGVVAQTACRPVSPPAPGTQWGCQGPAIVVWLAGVGAVKGTTECASLPPTSCTAVSPGPAFCADNPGFWSIGLFDVVCRAEVTGLVSSWTVHCAFPDP